MRDWSPSDATTKAEPTDGCPASSRVDTNQIDDWTSFTSASRVSPSARIFLIGSSSARTSSLADSRSAAMVSRAVWKRWSKLPVKLWIRSSLAESR